jgi:hypothetical protein
MSLSERYVQWTHKGGIQAVWGAGLLFVFLPAGYYASGKTPPVPFILLFPIGAVIGYLFGKTFGNMIVSGSGLYARELGDPATAVERFRLARSLPDVKPELRRYTGQKIIDLLLGPLGDRGRAMVELRMLIDQHPDSREADGARDALRNLKGEKA